MARRSYILSIDSSSSAVEVCVIDSSEGEIVRRFSLPIAIYGDGENIFEYDAEEIWEKQLEVLVRARDWAVDKEGEILGLAISNQRETVVAWDRETLKPICRAISWQDARNGAFLEKFRDKAELIRERTGLYISEYFSASKMCWILENVEWERERIRFGTVDSWLVLNLTKGVIHFTDVTNASRTMCMNLGREKWDGELLEMFGIPMGSLPTIRPSGSCFGFWEGIPIWGVIGDQQAALLTLGNREGAVQCTFGTGMFLLRNAGHQREMVDGVVTTVAWRIEGQRTVYAMENGSFSCGRTLDKLKEGGYFHRYEIERHGIPMSIYMEPVGRRLFLFGKGMDGPLAINFDLSKRRGDLVLKAALNGLAFMVKDIVASFERARRPIIEMQLGGQIATIDYLAQTQAVVLGRDVFISCNGDHSAIGAALLALLTMGKINWRDVTNLNESSRVFFRCSPLHSPESVGLDNLYSRLKFSL